MVMVIEIKSNFFFEIMISHSYSSSVIIVKFFFIIIFLFFLLLSKEKQTTYVTHFTYVREYFWV